MLELNEVLTLVLPADVVSYSQGEANGWLGLVRNPVASAIRGICGAWKQKIDLASQAQVVELIKSPKKLKGHLKHLCTEDPKMCLEIIDALSRRVTTSELKIIEFEAATELAKTNDERAKDVIAEALRSKDLKMRKRAAKVFARSISLGAEFNGALSGALFVQGSWLGFVNSPKSFASLRAICFSWEQKIGEASAEQIRLLMQDSKLLHAHLDHLRTEDPEMCLDILEALALRVKITGELLQVYLKAALDLFDRYPKRAEALADLAYRIEDNGVVLQLVASVFRKCGREPEANQIILRLILA